MRTKKGKIVAIVIAVCALVATFVYTVICVYGPHRVVTSTLEDRDEDVLQAAVQETVSEQGISAIEPVTTVSASDNVNDDLIFMNYDDSDVYDTISSNDVIGWWSSLYAESDDNEHWTGKCILALEDNGSCRLYVKEYDDSLSFGDNIVEHGVDELPEYTTFRGYNWSDYVRDGDGYVVEGHPETRISGEHDVREFENVRDFSLSMLDQPYVEGKWELIGKHVSVYIHGQHVVDFYVQHTDINAFMLDNSAGWTWAYVFDSGYREGGDGFVY